jgi:hypothetical protein
MLIARHYTKRLFFIIMEEGDCLQPTSNPSNDSSQYEVPVGGYESVCRRRHWEMEDSLLVPTIPCSDRVARMHF